MSRGPGRPKKRKLLKWPVSEEQARRAMVGGQTAIMLIARMIHDLEASLANLKSNPDSKPDQESVRRLTSVLDEFGCVAWERGPEEYFPLHITDSMAAILNRFRNGDSQDPDDLFNRIRDERVSNGTKTVEDIVRECDNGQEHRKNTVTVVGSWFGVGRTTAERWKDQGPLHPGSTDWMDVVACPLESAQQLAVAALSQYGRYTGPLDTSRRPPAIPKGTPGRRPSKPEPSQ